MSTIMTRNLLQVYNDVFMIARLIGLRNDSINSTASEKVFIESGLTKITGYKYIYEKKNQ